MICQKCGQEFKVQMAANVKCEGCKILTAVTSVLTVQCEKCNSVFQVPIQSKSFLSVKKDK